MAAAPRGSGEGEAPVPRPGREPEPRVRWRAPRGPCAGRRRSASPWFGRKRNGRGITPKSPEGWCAVLIVCVVASGAASLPRTQIFMRDGLVLAAVATLVLAVICTWET